jgi:hypothetical protein
VSLPRWDASWPRSWPVSASHCPKNPPRPVGDGKFGIRPRFERSGVAGATAFFPFMGDDGVYAVPQPRVGPNAAALLSFQQVRIEHARINRDAEFVARLYRRLRLIRRPDVTACQPIASIEDHRFCYSVPINQAPRRKPMLLQRIHRHVKLWRLLRRPDVTLCGSFGYVLMLSYGDYSGA